ncbi:30S ribosomal protein S19 [Candidatus Woesearchaeota archaeon]|nr:30S ribosomal protein S19 [Candidatus Woesearchaeota archaeon]
MVQDEYKFHGKTFEEVAKMDMIEFIKMLPARQRRSLKRESLKRYEPFFKKLESVKKGVRKKPVKTHARDMIVLPTMVGMTIHIFNGREFVPITFTKEMLGHFFGEFAMTRRKVEHSAPGIGATKSSTAQASKAK